MYVEYQEKLTYMGIQRANIPQPTLKIYQNGPYVPEWRAPNSLFFKLNFDGASRGNPGRASMGGIIHSSLGYPIVFYSQKIGMTTNNLAELMALSKGLHLVKALGIKHFIIGGFSQGISDKVGRLGPRETSNQHPTNWRLTHPLKEISLLLPSF